MRFVFAFLLLTTPVFAQTAVPNDTVDAYRALLTRANDELVRAAAQGAAWQRQIADLQKQLDDLKKPKETP